jgi:hypothetical protein
MGFTTHVWASGVAPIANVNEYAVLNRMADATDDDGEGCCLATATIARDIMADDRTVRRTIDALLERKLIAEGDQARAAYLRADRRPVVYDLLIPAKCFLDLGRTNERRAALGRPPITEENRPVQDPPPADAMRKKRADAGAKRPKKIGDNPAEQAMIDAGDDPEAADQAKHGVTDSPPVTGGLLDTPSATTCLVVQDGVTTSPARGDYKTADPGCDSGIDSEPPTPAAGDQTPAVDPAQENQGDASPEDPTPIGDSEALNAAVADAVAARAHLRGWSVHAVRRAVRDALDAGFTAPQVLAGLPALVADGASVYPARLKHFLAAQQRAAEANATGETLPPSYGMSADRRRCDWHPGYPADNCTACTTDQEIAALEAQREAAAQHETEAKPAGPTAAQLAAREAARAAGRPPAPRRELLAVPAADQGGREQAEANAA